MALALLMGLTASHAQKSEPDPGAESETAKIRFWNMCPTGDLSVYTKRGENEAPLMAAVAPYSFTGYIRTEPRKYILPIMDFSTRKSVGDVKIDAKKDRYYTIMATPKGKGVALTVIDDTYVYASDGPGEITVHQFFPGATAEVKVDGGTVQKISEGQSATFTSLPKNAELSVKALKADGSTYDSGQPIEFGNCKRMFALVIPDGYGRLRVRAGYSGFELTQEVIVPAADAAAAEGSSPQ